MNRNDYSVLHIARVVLEAVTPLSISTGNPDNVFDTALVRDANGLPAIPGTSIAGVLRHLWQHLHGSQRTRDLFGYQTGTTGQSSRLTVSWGVLLDSEGQPADELLIGDKATRLQDALYASVLNQIDAPVFRNRVHLSHRGAATDRGKFDRAVLPAGHRFALELRLWSAAEEDPDWTTLLDLFSHPGMRLGGATRAGLGCMHWVTVHQSTFDMENPAGRKAFLALNRGLTDRSGLKKYEPRKPHPNTEDSAWLSGTLRLQARGLWRIGQGNEPLDRNVNKPADLLPVVEERINWIHGKGTRTPAIALLPAASLKGALAHRMTFHARRFADSWNTGTPTDDRPEAVNALLGEIKNKAHSNKKKQGRAGALFIDDAFLPVTAVQIAHMMHNAIDRFTGGVRERVLYGEESLFGGELEIGLVLDTGRLSSGSTNTARQILKAALDDLCQGRLALGSRTTTGNGFFCGSLEGDLATWLNNPRKNEEAA